MSGYRNCVLNMKTWWQTQRARNSESMRDTGASISARSPDPTRRALLFLAAAFTPRDVISLPAAVTALAPSVLDERMSIIDALQIEAGAQTLGRSYLLEHPEEHDFESLWQLLIGQSCSSWDECRSRIAQAISNDFRRLDIVIVNSWVMARSEARLLALSYLGTTHAS